MTRFRERSRRTKGVLFGGLAVVVAATVIVAATVSPAGAAGDRGEGTGGGDGFCAEFTDAIGLYPGNPVTQMGLQVGTVTEVQARGPSVRVKFSLDSGRAYPAGGQAVIRSKSLLADRSVELVGNYTSGPVLRPGECLSLRQTFTPKSISEVAGSASDFLAGLSDNGAEDLQRALTGADRALAGTGAKANAMFTNAAIAAQDPDGFTADIGSSIRDMAPLTEDALANWNTIMSLLDQGPAVAELGTTLFYDVARFCRGIGWTIALLWDVQRHYGPELKKILLDVGVPLIHEVANRLPGWSEDASTLAPGIADVLRAQSSAAGGLSIPYQRPTVKVTPQQCTALGKACTPRGNTTTSVDLMDLVLNKAGI